MRLNLKQKCSCCKRVQRKSQEHRQVEAAANSNDRSTPGLLEVNA